MANLPRASRCLAACVLVATALPVAAQAGDDHLPQDLFFRSQPPVPGTFTRSCAGDFDGDGRMDVGLLSGGRVEVVLDAATLSWWLQSSDTANDLATLPPDPASGDVSFVAVGPGGVSEYVVSGTSLSSNALDTGAWSGASLVAAAEAGATQETCVVGVLSGGLSLGLLRRSPSGWTSQPLSPQIAPTKPIVEIELVDLEGDGDLELALGCEDASAAQVLVYDLASMTLLSTKTHPSRTLTSLCSGGQGVAGFLAWTVRSNEGAEELFLRDMAGIAGTLALGSVGVVGSTSAQWAGGDDRSDVVLSLSGLAELRLLTNVGTTRPAFSLGTYTAIAHGAVPTGNVAEPLAADLDGDGDVDVACTVQSNAKLVGYRNAEIDHASLEPVIGAEDAGIWVETPSGCTSGGGNDDVWLNIDMEIPTGSTATHAAWAVWRRGELGSNTPGAAVGSGLAMLDGNPIRFELPAPGTTGCAPQGVQFTKLYYFEIELQEWTAEPDPELVQAFGPAMYGIETHPSSSVNASHLVEELAAGASPMEVNTAPASSGSDPEAVGTVARIRELPGVLPGEPITK